VCKILWGDNKENHNFRGAQLTVSLAVNCYSLTVMLALEPSSFSDHRIVD